MRGTINRWKETYIQSLLGYAIGDSLSISRNLEEITGNTEVMLTVLEDLQTDFDSKAFLNRLRDMPGNKEYRQSILDRLPKDKSEINDDGVAMAVVPVALMYDVGRPMNKSEIRPEFLERILDYFSALSENEQSYAGALALAASISLSRGDSGINDGRLYLRNLGKIVENNELSSQIDKVVTSYDRPDEVFRRISEGKNLGPSSLETVPAAVYCAIKNNNFRDAVGMALETGSRSVVAMTGAIAGALYGSVDQEWQEQFRSSEVGRKVYQRIVDGVDVLISKADQVLRDAAAESRIYQN